MTEPTYFSRDISWLSFNQRVLSEASHTAVPLAERFTFLSIFSSNLDEWYRVRMPALMAKQQFAISRPNSKFDLSASLSEFDEARQLIQQQQEAFGSILREQLIPSLAQHNIVLLYNQTLPSELFNTVSDYFFTVIAAFLQPVSITPKTNFFPENNKLYLLVSFSENDEETQAIINIPSEAIPRFLSG